MGLDLSVKIGKLKLKNPVLVASGTFGHAREFAPFIDLKKLGGIVTKTITVKPRLGNPPQRIVETPSGMLNAIGLQNPGVERFIEEKLPFLRKTGVPVIVSVMGYSIGEFLAVTKRLEEAGGFDGYELNLSCPNVSYRTNKTNVYEAVRMFAHDEKLIEEVVSAVRKATKKTVIAKLGPDVSDIGKMARAAEKAGADAVSLINTLIAMVIDVKTRKPVLANKTGGLSGPCIRPVAVRMTWDAAKAVKIPVIGIGGIMNAQDALEFIIAGASAVQVGTANFMNPAASIEILDGIKDFMRKEQLGDLSEIVGSIKA
ncbi:MAG: dihydroorotate dehydrogenase [Candidatus Omnitrophota bacterium]